MNHDRDNYINKSCVSAVLLYHLVGEPERVSVCVTTCKSWRNRLPLIWANTCSPSLSGKGNTFYILQYWSCSQHNLSPLYFGSQFLFPVQDGVVTSRVLKRGMEFVEFIWKGWFLPALKDTPSVLMLCASSVFIFISSSFRVPMLWFINFLSLCQKNSQENGQNTKILKVCHFRMIQRWYENGL